MQGALDISKVLSLFIDDKYFTFCASIYAGKPARGIRRDFVNMTELDIMFAGQGTGSNSRYLFSSFFINSRMNNIDGSPSAAAYRKKTG